MLYSLAVFYLRVIAGAVGERAVSVKYLYLICAKRSGKEVQSKCEFDKWRCYRWRGEGALSEDTRSLKTKKEAPALISVCSLSHHWETTDESSLDDLGPCQPSTGSSAGLLDWVQADGCRSRIWIVTMTCDDVTLRSRSWLSDQRFTEGNDC